VTLSAILLVLVVEHEDMKKIVTIRSPDMDAWDMISPFVIPEFVDPFALSVDDCCGDRKLTGVNLLKNWGKVFLKQCQNWRRDSFDYACEDLTSMEWAKSLMMNSCDVLLVNRIDKKFDELDLYKQGGVTYIKIALDGMFTISNTVVTTLQGFFEAFAKDSIAKVPNEDVRAATEQNIAVAERLAKVSALPSESTHHILEGFTWCSVIVFRQTFAQLLVAERLQQLRYLTNRNDSSRLFDIKRLCKEANDLFNSLNVSNEWIIPQKHFVDACFNFGDPDHGTIPKCPKPRPNSPRMKAVMEAEVDAAAEVALLIKAAAMVVIEPTPAESGRAMMLRCLQRLPLMVALENITENGAWFANCAGGIPPILLDITTNGSIILSPFPFLPLIVSGLNQGRILLREVVVGLRPPPWLLQQPRLVSHLVAHLARVLGRLLHSTRPIPRTDNLLPSLLISKEF
jgi:hypothetical protein